MKPSYRRFAWISALVLTTTAGGELFVGRAAAADPAALIEALKSPETAVFDKAKACQRLAIVGDATAVPTLAALLSDPQLASYARTALEAISDPAAGDALRDSLLRLEGDLLVGAINSVGQRRDANAFEQLANLVASDDDSVAAAAARAVGRIGDKKAAALLQESMLEAESQRREALASACLVCAQRLAQSGHATEAAELFDQVRSADVSPNLQVAATRGAILTRGDEGVPLLVELLESDDDARFELALQTARAMPVNVAPQLAAQFDRQPARRQALLLLALRDLRDPNSVPIVLRAVEADDPEVQVQAVRVAGDWQLAEAAPLLLRAALADDDRLAAAAREALAQLAGGGVDQAIVELFRAEGDAERRLAIELAAQRGTSEATPALLEIARSDDPAARQAALRALGSTVRLAELPALLAMAEQPPSEEDAAAIRAAARAACVRMPRTECAALLARRLPEASDDLRTFLLEQLGVVGGPAALAAVVDVARNGNDAGQDAATRVLGEWLTADAAPAMHELARSGGNDKYKIRVLRGYLRLARQLDMPTAERIEVCRNALELAERDDERQLVLDVLRRYHSPAGFPLALQLLDRPALREQACATILAIAAAERETSPQAAAAALQQVVATSRRMAVRQQAAALLERANREARKHE